MQTIKLPQYPIYCGPVAEALSQLLSGTSFSRMAVLVDENSSSHCLPLLGDLTERAECIQIDSGEDHKKLDTCKIIWSALAGSGFDRHSLLINLGGGVIGDMGGFCAATYMRGIPFIQVPTTLLSQVDASIGGKLGVDFNGLKNFIGLFQNPIGIAIDPAFLKTLPVRELRSGFAEVIKHALIADLESWQRIRSKAWTETEWESEILTSIRIKKAVVEKDPFEKGVRKTLNFGHTVGHALETLALNSTNPLLHGEAIAVGMMAESFLSMRINGLQTAAYEDICTYISETFHDVSDVRRFDVNSVIQIMKSDKKNKNQRIMLSLLTSIGRCGYDVEVDPKDVAASLQSVRDFLT